MGIKEEAATSATVFVTPNEDRENPNWHCHRSRRCEHCPFADDPSVKTSLLVRFEENGLGRNLVKQQTRAEARARLKQIAGPDNQRESFALLSLIIDKLCH